jgi:hypothetical protein
MWDNGHPHKLSKLPRNTHITYMGLCGHKRASREQSHLHPYFMFLLVRSISTTLAREAVVSKTE